MSGLLAATPGVIDSGDTAWILISTALVLMMTPALGLFYAGLSRSKNTLNTFMMSVASLGVVTIAWVVLGYSFAFADGNDVIGGFGHAFLDGIGLDARDGLAIPELLFVVFQASFCVLTAALISGAIVERMRFVPYLVFIVFWSVLVFAPLAHWVWGGGWLADRGVLDFAGGVPVEMASGFSALAAAMVVGARKDFGRQALLPHNAVFVLLGAGLLWFGWFGFNGGSALASGGSAALAFANTLLAPAATLTVWIVIDLIRVGRATAVGAATAIVVGAVSITPAAGYVGPLAAMLLGAIAAGPSYAFIVWRLRTRLDESLDVLAAHGLGGIVGMLFIGFFAEKSWNGISDGLLFGHAGQLADQAIAVAAAVAYSFVVSFAILKAIGLVLPLRVAIRDEGIGLDVAEHGEEAYTSGEGHILIREHPVAIGAGAAEPGTA